MAPTNSPEDQGLGLQAQGTFRPKPNVFFALWLWGG